MRIRRGVGVGADLVHLAALPIEIPALGIEADETPILAVTARLFRPATVGAADPGPYPDRPARELAS